VAQLFSLGIIRALLEMRTIAIFANIGLLAITCYEFAGHGMPQGREFWIVSFLILAPIFSLIALFDKRLRKKADQMDKHDHDA
jgi:hypothetical protein